MWKARANSKTSLHSQQPSTCFKESSFPVEYVRSPAKELHSPGKYVRSPAKELSSPGKYVRSPASFSSQIGNVEDLLLPASPAPARVHIVSKNLFASTNSRSPSKRDKQSRGKYSSKFGKRTSSPPKFILPKTPGRKRS